MIVALAGGVGAAKFLQGLVRATDPADITVIVNTGDDITLYGLHISPDLDSVTYTLADANDSDRGWGLAHETFRCLEHLSRYPVPSWFQLGDGDLATHLFRTSRLAEGARLSEVTAEIANAWGVGAHILPMTDDKVTTRVVIEEAGTGRGMDLHFQEYFVERQAQDSVREINYEGVEVASPAPGVLDAIEAADGIIVCPSNPVASIGPILAVDGIREALQQFQNKIVAISPLIRDAPVKGPADRMMPAAGLEVSAAGIADAYRDFIHTLVIDFADESKIPEIEALEVEAAPGQTLMRGVPQAKALAKTVLRLLEP